MPPKPSNRNRSKLSVEPGFEQISENRNLRNRIRHGTLNDEQSQAAIKIHLELVKEEMKKIGARSAYIS
jgi:hypothetical protein